MGAASTLGGKTLSQIQIPPSSTKPRPSGTTPNVKKQTNKQRNIYYWFQTRVDYNIGRKKNIPQKRNGFLEVKLRRPSGLFHTDPFLGSTWSGPRSSICPRVLVSEPVIRFRISTFSTIRDCKQKIGNLAKVCFKYLGPPENTPHPQAGRTFSSHLQFNRVFQCLFGIHKFFLSCIKKNSWMT